MIAGVATVAATVAIDQTGAKANGVAAGGQVRLVDKPVDVRSPGGFGGIATDGDDDEAQLAEQQALEQMQQAEQQAEQQEQLDLQQALQDEQQALLTEQQATLSVPGT